jgi:hypothetical protein
MPAIRIVKPVSWGFVERHPSGHPHVTPAAFIMKALACGFDVTLAIRAEPTTR